MALEAADNTGHAGDRSPHGADTGAPHLIARFPAGLANAPGLAYALNTLLRPMGLAVSAGPSTDRSTIELTWPGSTAPGVPVDPARLAGAFSALSGQGELDAPRDRLDRVATASGPAEGSTEPALSYWAREMTAALSRAHPTWRVPATGLTVHLTHDIDRVCALEPMGMLGQALRAVKGLAHLSAGPVRELGRWVRHGGKLLELYQAVMELERASGATATYFAMSGPYSLRRYGARSGANSARLRRVLDLARRLGHRVGLHGCAYSLRHQDYASQRRRLSEAFGEEITWHRSHYLVYDPRRSPVLLEAAGLRVDSTVASHQANGFRAGLAWPYRLWNWTEGRPSRVVELPMVFMDRVQARPDEQEWEELYMLLDRVAGVGGTVAVNFHMDYFVGRPERLDAYRRLLQWLGERRARLSDDLSGYGD